HRGEVLEHLLALRAHVARPDHLAVGSPAHLPRYIDQLCRAAKRYGMRIELRRRAELLWIDVLPVHSFSLIERAARGDRPERLDAAAAHAHIPVVEVHRRIAMPGHEQELLA